MDKFYKKLSRLLGVTTWCDPCSGLVRAAQPGGASWSADLHCCTFPWHSHPCNHTDLLSAFSFHQISWHSSSPSVPGNSHWCCICVEGGWLPRAGWRFPALPVVSPLTLCVFAEHGFVGYSEELMFNNTLPDYSQGESFFTVFGVFFPAATGTVKFYPPSLSLRSHTLEMSRSKGKVNGTVLGHSRLMWLVKNAQAFLQHLKFYAVLFCSLECVLLSLCGQNLLDSAMGWWSGINPFLPRKRLRHWSEPMLSGHKVSSLCKEAYLSY